MNKTIPSGMQPAHSIWLHPPFNYPEEKYYPHATEVTTTVGLQAHYGEQLSEDLSWIKPGTIIGRLLFWEGGWQIYHCSGASMGEVESKIEAIEWLLKLYVNQNRPAVSAGSEVASPEVAA